MQESRQVRRQLARLKKKFNTRMSKGSVNSEGKSRHIMNPQRDKVLRGMSIAIANAMNPPDTIDSKDLLTYMAEQRALAHELNSEFISRSKGRGGKKPARKTFIQSIALRKDRTNPVGHFA